MIDDWALGISIIALGLVLGGLYVCWTMIRELEKRVGRVFDRIVKNEGEDRTFRNGIEESLLALRVDRRRHEADITRTLTAVTSLQDSVLVLREARQPKLEAAPVAEDAPVAQNATSFSRLLEDSPLDT